jgi:lipopolysaccharide/colanic/teichoic acid biosynthesis glycosyltransferase
MRSIRRYQLFRRASDAALDQMRRLADLLLAAVLLLLTFPLMLAVALAIKWEEPGPIFERQTCIGRGSRRFQLLKFRTMALDPEHTAPAWTRKATRIGEFLRYTRIENLPQIYNLLRGDISLIDPDGSSPSFLE